MTDVSAGFRPPCWCPSMWAPTWRLHTHTNLYKFGKNVSPHIFHKKNCCDLNLGESLCISTFFLFPDSGLNLLNDFDFLFWSILNGVTLKTSNWHISRLQCKCGLYYICFRFALEETYVCVIFAMRKFGVNPFFRPVRVKIQSALFLFDDMQISGRVSWS